MQIHDYRENRCHKKYFFILARPFLGKFARSLEDIFNTYLYQIASEYNKKWDNMT